MLKILIVSWCALVVLAQNTSLGPVTTLETDAPETTVKSTSADLTSTNDGTVTEQPITTTQTVETTTTKGPETTVTTTTTTPVPPTAAPAGYKDVNVSFSDGSRECLKGTLALKFDIPYVGNGTNKTATVFLPEDVTQVRSICNDTEAPGKYYQLLELTWQQGHYNLTLQFEKDGETTALSYLKLSYNVSGNDFPESVSQDILKTELNKTIFNSSSKSYYRCDSEQDFSLTNGKVTFKDVSLTLFFDGQDRSESVCALDDTTSDIVPIAVGCALAGLVIIVIIAYLVGRRRSRQKGYQSV